MRNIVIMLAVLAMHSCSNSTKKVPDLVVDTELPVMSEAPIDAFGFLAHNGDTITELDMNGKVTVVDFFFTSCPTICPKMKSQLLRVYDTYKNEDKMLILSHSIDPEYDTREVLADFAERLDVKGDTWYFLTGEKDSIYAMADRYMILAEEDPSAPGGYAHSGAFILLDSMRNIRGVYDGTKEQAVDSLIIDIKKLM